MIDPHHPRAESLRIRNKIVRGVEIGITSLHGLVAQGRGEAFDYLIGEKTTLFAKQALQAAAASLLLAKFPVLSVNGNSAALCPAEYIQLADLLGCPIEVNLFHRTKEREEAIQSYLKKNGGNTIVGVGEDASEEISGIASKRKYVSSLGIKKADVIFVPLEDGDRCEALVKDGRQVIAVDLNPLSRTAQRATITIVDNIVRALPLLTEAVRRLQTSSPDDLRSVLSTYDNKKTLSNAIHAIDVRLQDLAK